MVETPGALLNPTSSRPLYEQLETLLRSWIEGGRLQPGDRIPSESELSQAYSISRVTVRRALSILVAEGVLYRRSGKGTYVADAKVPYRPATLFSFSRTLRDLGHEVTTTVLAFGLVPAPAHVARNLGLANGAQVVVLRRLRHIDGEPMALHTDYMPAHLFAPLLHEDLATRALTEAMEAVSGLPIASSEDCVEATLARSDEAALLKIRRGAAVLLVRGTAYTRDRLPVRSTIGVFRGDHFRFLVAATTDAGSEEGVKGVRGLTFVQHC